MAKLPDHIRFIVLDSKSSTGESFSGTFKIKAVLTNEDRFTIERVYKSFLPDDSSSSEQIKADATVIAELNVRVLESPAWFQESRGGRAMIDMQPLYDLFVKIKEAQTEWQLEVSKLAKGPNA